MKPTRAIRKTRQAVVRSESPAKAEPSRDEVAQRAYELYVARGRTDGDDLDDWLQAERELRNRAV